MRRTTPAKPSEPVEPAPPSLANNQGGITPPRANPEPLLPIKKAM